MKILFITALILISAFSVGQTIERSVIAAAGNQVVTESISVSWTLGEIAVNTLTSEGTILTQGFHQGNLFINAIEGTQFDFQLRTYPNPVIDKLIIESLDLDQLYEIIDVNCKVLINGYITANPYELDFTNLPSGVYFLRVEHRHTHKVIKK